MKKYIQFIKENFYNKKIVFSIDLRNNNINKIRTIFDLALEYFINSNYLIDEFKYIIEKLDHKPPVWAIVFEVINKNGCISSITTPDWGVGIDYMENILTVDEFLNIGFENIEEYLNSKKYNL